MGNCRKLPPPDLKEQREKKDAAQSAQCVAVRTALAELAETQKPALACSHYCLRCRCCSSVAVVVASARAQPSQQKKIFPSLVFSNLTTMCLRMVFCELILEQWFSSFNVIRIIGMVVKNSGSHLQRPNQ